MQRLFRCQDKKGSFTAETTAWEATASAATPAELGPPEGQSAHILAAASQAARTAKSNKSV
jgi:hypothetical protein